MVCVLKSNYVFLLKLSFNTSFTCNVLNVDYCYISYFGVGEDDYSCDNTLLLSFNQ